MISDRISLSFKYISGTLVFVLLANIVLFAALFAPKAAMAIPTEEVGPLLVIQTQSLALQNAGAAKNTVAQTKTAGAEVATGIFEIWSRFKSDHGVIAEITSSLFLVMMHTVLGKITNDIVAWINGGGKGKIRVIQDPGKLLRDSVDEAGGVLMGAILNVDPKTLCDASFLKQKLAITFAGPYAVPTFDEKVACTFTGMAEGLRKFREDFRNGGWPAFIEYTAKQNNQIGLTLETQEELARIKSERSAEAVAKLQISKGFLGQEVCTVERGPSSAPQKWVGKDLETAFKEMSAGLGGSHYDFSVSENNRLESQYYAQFKEATRLGLDTSNNAMKSVSEYQSANSSNSDDFKNWLISNGGKVNCKTVTPAEQVSELANTALMAPIKKLEGAINGLTDHLGTGMGSVLKPYVLAIGNASLNLLVNKEKGLIADVFKLPTRDRNTSRRPSDALQDNVQRANSAGQIAGSANDFRSFIMKSLVDFSIFVNTSAQVMDASDELGRLPINRVEYARAFNADPQGGAYAKGNNKYVTNQFLYGSDANTTDKVNDKLIGNLKGWLTNIDCEAAVLNTTATQKGLGYTYSATDPNKPFADTTSITTNSTIFVNASSTTSIIPIAIATCKTETVTNSDGTPGTILVPNTKMITTYPSGKILFEEAQWCGAYSQETPLQIEVNEYPVTPYITGTDAGFDYARYNDDGDSNNIIDRFTRAKNGFTETFIIPNSDVNHSNALESTTSNPDLLAMTPKFSGDVLDSAGAPIIGAGIILAQTAVAGDYVFGGYNKDGFSKNIFQISSRADVGDLPTALAGAEAVYYPPNKRIYIFGGRNEQGFSDAVYEFDTNTKGIRTMSAHFPKGIYGLTGAYSESTGRIYLFGGKMGDTRPTTGDPDVSVTEATVSDIIFEFNQQTDTIVAKNARLPEPLAHASAAPAIDKDKVKKIYIFGGMTQYGEATNSIIAYDPKADDDSRAISSSKTRLKSPRGYLAAVPKDQINKTVIRIIGGEASMGRWDVIEEYDASKDNITTIKSLPEPLSQMGRSLDNGVLVGGILNSDAGTPSAMIFPQGDIYYIPGGAVAVQRQQPVLQKYYSPTYEGGSVSLLNIRENRAYKDPTLTAADPDIINELRANGDEVFLPRDSFYPELNEKIQELMEKLRIIKGYHYKTPNVKDYEAGVAQQVGSTPDDDPYDNNPINPNYPDRPTPSTIQADCSPPDVWNETDRQCVRKGYKGSVSDLMTKYKNIADIYQTLYSGVNDEHALEGIDQNMTVLTPAETNMKLALIGQRCPTLAPSATSSTSEISEECPAYSGNAGGEYNMGKRFRFKADDARQNPTGLTTGFATNPFNNKKSSSLAGILNLDEMATQLQSLPPDKNIVKLVRLRQVLEQLQVCEVREKTTGKIINKSCKDAEGNQTLQQVSPPPIRLPGKDEYIYPEPLEGVDMIRVSLFGFEKIQNWLNSTSTADGLPDRNKSIQELIESYGYTGAKEAYPEISKDLDTALQDAVNQITDKTREVFLKRMEENLETARVDAQYRLKRFVEYARDLNSAVKLGVTNTEAQRLGGALVDTNRDQTDNDMYVTRVEAFTAGSDNPHLADNIIKNSAVTNNEKSGIIGSAIYKIKNLARFIGMDINGVEFTAMITQYANSVAPTGADQTAINKDLNIRLKNSVTDAYLLYRGVSDQTDSTLSTPERARTAGRCGYSEKQRAYYCDLNGNGSDGQPIRIYKDASMKLKELENNFDLAVEEFNKIKDDFTSAISDAQGQKQGFEDLLTNFSGMEDEYNKANACAGLPDIRFQPSSTNSQVWATLGTAAALGLATMGAAGLGLLTGAGIAGIGSLWVTAAIPVVGVVVAVIAAFVGDAARKKAHRKYDKAIRKAKDDCVTALINYNRKLGQLSDSFICGRTNQIYQEQ